MDVWAHTSDEYEAVGGRCVLQPHSQDCFPLMGELVFFFKKKAQHEIHYA